MVIEIQIRFVDSNEGFELGKFKPSDVDDVVELVKLHGVYLIDQGDCKFLYCGFSFNESPVFEIVVNTK